MKEQEHIIQKMVVEVTTSQVKTANSLKNNISLFLRDKVFPELEQVFDRYNIPGSVVRFDELNIEVVSQNGENYGLIKTEILAQVENQLKTRFSQKTQRKPAFGEAKKEVYGTISAAQNQEDIFLFFLQNGYFPWFGNERQIGEFLNDRNWLVSFEKDAFIQKLKAVFEQDNKTFRRLIYQFPAEITLAFLSQISQKIKSTESRILSLAENFSPQFKADFFWALFSVLTQKSEEKMVGEVKLWFEQCRRNQKIDDGFFSGALSEACKLILQFLPEKVLAGKNFQDTLDQGLLLVSKQGLDMQPPETSSVRNSDKTEKKIAEIKETSFFETGLPEIEIKNAGLVLLHPFLKPFFSALNFIDSKGKLVQNRRNTAVQALHFLATGEEDVFEGNLVFEKFLCGIPLNEPLQKQSLLTQAEKDEAENLLKEVIKNWQALKSTSPEGFRQMFLQRDGKLAVTDNNFRLTVERKAQDILLEKLNWNISVIQLKWMTCLLFVDW